MAEKHNIKCYSDFIFLRGFTLSPTLLLLFYLLLFYSIKANTEKYCFSPRVQFFAIIFLRALDIGCERDEIFPFAHFVVIIYFFIVCVLITRFSSLLSTAMLSKVRKNGNLLHCVFVCVCGRGCKNEIKCMKIRCRLKINFNFLPLVIFAFSYLSIISFKYYSIFTFFFSFFIFQFRFYVSIFHDMCVLERSRVVKMGVAFNSFQIFTTVLV